MANKTFNTRVKNKRDTASNWEAVATTFQPLDGELIIVDTSAGKTRFKVGRYDAAKGRLLYYNEIPFTDEYLYNDLNESQGKIYDKLKSIDEREPLIGTTNTLSVEQVKTAILAGRPVVISYTDATYGELKFTNFAYSTVEDTIVSDMIAYYSGYGYILGELIGINQWSFKTTVIAERSDMSQFATKEYVDNGLDVKASKDIATTSANGLMSSTDKTKLDGIAEGANKTTVDANLSTASTNPVQNKVVKAALDGKAPSSHTHDEYLSHPIQLQENTDYGTTLPSNPTNGRLFFQETSVTSLIDLVYPVGAVYISMNQTSPQTLFGGAWTQIQGRFLIGAGTAYPAGSTGGEATHTLTASEIPDHTHSFKYTGQSVTTGVNSIRLYQSAPNQYNAYSGGQSSNCGGQAHNNMPPYMAVYMWTRTA